jgi:TldD protein
MISHRSHISHVALALLGLAFAFGVAQAAQKQQEAADPVLQAMKAEMERSKSQLQLEQMQRPFFIEYRITDDDSFRVEAVFGALRLEQRSHARLLRVVVRVGDYKQDSSVGAGDGVLDLAPEEDNVMAIRHRIWLATDQAYKNAIESLTRKQAQLKQYENETMPDDFSHEKPVESIASPLHLEVDADRWRTALKSATALYRSDASLEMLDARASFQAQNKYLVNSEGTVLRQPETLYSLSVNASAQAPDGMRIQKGYARTAKTPAELPTTEELRASTQKVLDMIAELRKAPLMEDQYRGPVLLAPDASDSIVARLVGVPVLGRRPRPGVTTRTTGDFASSWKQRVLPDFMDVTDDPTVERAAGRSLLGFYHYDDDGVEAHAVKLIEHGTLLNYLMGRQPIRDFPASNGHGRGLATSGAGPAIGNLFVKSSAPMSFDDLKKKLIEMCKERGQPYGYLALSTSGTRPEPLYRVYVADGHQELVRGAEFFQFDARALRSDLIAAGSDEEVSNHLDGAPHSIVVGSMLFGELEIRKTPAGRDKLPDYPPPPAKAN